MWVKRTLLVVVETNEGVREGHDRDCWLNWIWKMEVWREGAISIDSKRFSSGDNSIIHYFRSILNTLMIDLKSFFFVVFK